MGNACAGGVPHHVFFPRVSRFAVSAHAASDGGRIVTNASGMAYSFVMMTHAEKPVRSPDHVGSVVVPVSNDARYTFAVRPKYSNEVSAMGYELVAWTHDVVVFTGNDIPTCAMIAVRNFAFDVAQHDNGTSAGERRQSKEMRHMASVRM